jgi:hypothetical protein
VDHLLEKLPFARCGLGDLTHENPGSARVFVVIRLPISGSR